jgi:hypothetical protein
VVIREFSVWRVCGGLLVVTVIVIFGCCSRLAGSLFCALFVLVGLFVAAGLIRGSLGVSEAGANRYMYEAVPLLTLVVVSALARLRWSALAAQVFSVVVVVALIGNLLEFRNVVGEFKDASSQENVEIQTINAVRNAPDLDMEAGFKANGLTSAAWGIEVGPLLASEDRFGSPVPAASLTALGSSNPAFVDGVLRDVLRHTLRLSRASDVSTCANPGIADFLLVSGGNRTIKVSGNGALHIKLGWATTPAKALVFDVVAGLWTLHVPNVGRAGFEWHVVLTLRGQSVQACR